MLETPAHNGKPSDGVQRLSGVERVYRALRREILTLVLAPSKPLDEKTLSRRFGVSRTPIREALVRLAADGLALSLPNRGAIVAPLDLTRVTSYFDALTLVQRVVTRLAARHHRTDELPHIEALQAEFADAVGRSDALAMIEVNREFHLAIAETGRNPYYSEFYARLLDEGRRMLRLYYASFDDRLPGRYVHEHDALLNAVRARDEELAERLARLHAEQVAEQVRSLIGADLGAVLALVDRENASAEGGGGGG
ncbi:MAG TPA: GntR family transcriptional regulator [Trueperaceae bacterium]|nr:GntR family transcriptional regulator [Trueperaceae bacterium]